MNASTAVANAAVDCCLQYVCQFCCKIFKQRHSYTFHIRGVHGVGDPVRCPKCGRQGFTNSGTLSRHTRKCGQNDGPSQPDEAAVVS